MTVKFWLRILSLLFGIIQFAHAEGVHTSSDKIQIRLKPINGSSPVLIDAGVSPIASKPHERVAISKALAESLASNQSTEKRMRLKSVAASDLKKRRPQSIIQDEEEVQRVEASDEVEWDHNVRTQEQNAAEISSNVISILPSSLEEY